MSARLLHPDEYELASRSSADTDGTFNLDDDDFESQIPGTSRLRLRQTSWWSRLFSPSGYRQLKSHARPVLIRSSRASCTPRFCARRRFFGLHIVLGALLGLVAFASIFIPSYTRPPAHYATLRQLALEGNTAGRGNPHNQKVFIAASLYDRGGDLARGQWGSQLLQLIDLLGPKNVFVSIYENDSGEEAGAALRELERQIPSAKSIVFEEHIDLETIPSLTMPGGEMRIPRIEYLAATRNRALQPMSTHPETRYDKLLYLNDIFYDPVDALQLLFSTNLNESGDPQYRAACAVDFDNPFKFYDTFATRDLEGYSMGLPFFPWFSSAGKSASRSDVLHGKDAVRVQSCWGGMVAFDAKYFQDPLPGGTAPARFRSTSEVFWEGSECCLIHADIRHPQAGLDGVTESGIYMNPYIRVAYDQRTLSWLHITRRWERLYSWVQAIGNYLVGLPWNNPRRAEVPGQSVTNTVWVPDANQVGGGSFQTTERIAGNGGYCGTRSQQVIVEHRQPGQKGFENIPVPS
ncbi:Alpha-1,3-mannosyltransferase [Penicillium ucsense]|uniref:Alpha-1,3-mannosyltransferase n=1 Tax=Penicillium ucsense TaxID=2839758 RepID=A0A8J8W285_9EURO|nr:Alpha-1,3-mannosyltransferase [Penicillium ucsense]KAF7734589.1 Alpha-1,3-mannosyltransferase [Penicillium ucsense]